MILLFLLGPISSPEAEPFTDIYTALFQLGLGAFIAGPFIYLWRDERKQKNDLQKLLIEKLTAIVTESTHALESVKEGLDSTVDKIAEKSSRMDLDKALRRLEHISDELGTSSRDK